MSKSTNDGLTQSSTRCFTGVSKWHEWHQRVKSSVPWWIAPQITTTINTRSQASTQLTV